MSGSILSFFSLLPEGWAHNKYYFISKRLKVWTTGTAQESWELTLVEKRKSLTSFNFLFSLWLSLGDNWREMLLQGEFCALQEISVVMGSPLDQAKHPYSDLRYSCWSSPGICQRLKVVWRLLPCSADLILGIFCGLGCGSECPVLVFQLLSWPVSIAWCFVQVNKALSGKKGYFPKNLNVAGAQLQIFSCKLSVHKSLSLAGVWT